MDAKYLKDAATCASPAVYHKSCSVCGAKSEDATFTSGDKLSHTFTAETVEDKYLKDAATCTSPAIYWKSCSACGAKSEEATFTHGEPDLTKHNVADNFCTVCGGLEINQNTFPDANFRGYVKNLSGAGDGFLTPQERSGITQLNVNNKGISSLTGIAWFPQLKTMFCNNNQLTSLDVSGNPALEELRCLNNQLTELDLSSNTALINLNCSFNKLEKLDVSRNTKLELLYCASNNLTELDVRANTALTDLVCYDNSLTSLDMSQNTGLKVLQCQSNRLTHLNVGSNTALEELSCGSNQLVCLDVSSNPALTILDCSGNSRTVTVKDNKFDLSSLPGFDVSKASGWTGGTVSGTSLTAAAASVTYDYDTGKGTVTFTLNIQGLCEDSHDFSAETVDEKYLASAATCTSPAAYYYSCSAGCGSMDTKTFTSGKALEHSFTKKTVADKYLKSEATCTDAAVYYYSCSACGEKGTETFTSGTTLPHSFTAKVADARYLKSGATCTAAAEYYFSCSGCGLKGTETFTEGTALKHTFDRQIAEDRYLVSAASVLAPAYYVKSCVCGAAGTETFVFGEPLPGTRVFVSPAELGGAGEVWIDGIRYPVKTEGDVAYVDLPDGATVSVMVTYGYHVGDANDVHTQYPVSMQVWVLEHRADGNYTVRRIRELDNILQYSGSSIRITGNKGIRMITSIESHKRDALIAGDLAGCRLMEYGTVLALSGELDGGKPLTLGQSYARSNFAYKRDVADPIFAISGNLVQYTNVLVGFSLDQCKEDIAMRSYMILEDANGNRVTLYGGIVYRSIGYIAYQNRTVFAPGTAAYNYVWEIIHHVYGDRYDADYKG